MPQIDRPTRRVIQDEPHRDRYEVEEPQEDLISYFEKSATVVRQSFRDFEKGVINPLFTLVVTSFRDRPIRSTFLTTFALMSLLPILSFGGFALFIFASFIFFALAVGIISAVATVGFAGSVLAWTLAALFILSIPVTAWVVTTYLTLRFVFLARALGFRPALTQWTRETRAQFLRFRAAKKEVERKAEDHGSDSDTVLVGLDQDQKHSQGAVIKAEGSP